MMQGEEWIVEAFGCNAAMLRDGGVLRALCSRIIAELDLHVMGQPLWQQFPTPGGVTGMYLLSESHLACHTWPEHGTASFNLFTCRDRARWQWEEALREALAADRVTVRRIDRGVLPRGVLPRSHAGGEFAPAHVAPHSASAEIAAPTEDSART